jgi:hypothetical protein
MSKNGGLITMNYATQYQLTFIQLRCKTYRIDHQGNEDRYHCKTECHSQLVPLAPFSLSQVIHIQSTPCTITIITGQLIVRDLPLKMATDPVSEMLGFLSYLEFWMMDKVHNPSNFECSTPSSEYFKFYTVICLNEPASLGCGYQWPGLS